MSFPRRHRTDLSRADFARILLIKPSSLGDVIHGLPILHALQERYPAARIDWLIAKPFAPLLTDQPHINELIVFDRARYGGVGRSWNVTGEFLRFLRQLARRRYDLVIDAQGLFRSGFLNRATGARTRIGFAEAREGGWMFYTHRVRGGEPDAHAVDRNLRLLRPLGIKRPVARFDLALSNQTVTEANALLSEAGVNDAQPIVAVVPGARWETKVWPPERFAETIATLQRESDTTCILLGGPDERDLCTRIAESATVPTINLAGRTTLPQLAALIQRADTVLCHDSGAMHLAVALDRPLVCITGPTNPKRTGPYRRPEDVLRLDLDCSPCYYRRLAQCPHNHRCMQDLPTQQVVTRVSQSPGLSATPASTDL